MMLRFAFVSDAAEREYKNFPENIQDDFGKALRIIQYNGSPDIEVAPLSGFSVSVLELKINGSPAYRCVYTTKYLDTIVVLHSFVKTKNGPDRQAMQVATQRLKELQSEVRKAG